MASANRFDGNGIRICEQGDAPHTRLSRALDDFLNVAYFDKVSGRESVRMELARRCAILELAALAASETTFETNAVLEQLILGLEKTSHDDQRTAVNAQRRVLDLTPDDWNAIRNSYSEIAVGTNPAM